jgi:hypothetical protein
MADHAVENSGIVQLNDAWYDLIRQLVEKVLPGLGVLYVALATIWHWGYEVEVGGTISALAIFGGVILSLSRKGYKPSEEPPEGYDGAVVGDINEAGEPIVRVQLDQSATENILNKDKLVIKGYDPSAS